MTEIRKKLPPNGIHVALEEDRRRHVVDAFARISTSRFAHRYFRFQARETFVPFDDPNGLRHDTGELLDKFAGADGLIGNATIHVIRDPHHDRVDPSFTDDLREFSEYILGRDDPKRESHGLDARGESDLFRAIIDRKERHITIVI